MALLELRLCLIMNKRLFSARVVVPRGCSSFVVLVAVLVSAFPPFLLQGYHDLLCYSLLRWADPVQLLAIRYAHISATSEHILSDYTTHSYMCRCCKFGVLANLLADIGLS